MARMQTTKKEKSDDDGCGKNRRAACGYGSGRSRRRICAVQRPAYDGIPAGPLALPCVAVGLYGFGGNAVCDTGSRRVVDGRTLFHPGGAAAGGQRNHADAHGPARRAHRGQGSLADRMPAGGTLALDGACTSVSVVESLEKALAEKRAVLRDHDFVSALWQEGRPPIPATEAWLLEPSRAGISPGKSCISCGRGLPGRTQTPCWCAGWTVWHGY